MHPRCHSYSLLRPHQCNVFRGVFCRDVFNMFLVSLNIDYIRLNPGIFLNPVFFKRVEDMKWCMFANRRCCREDCVGWIHDNCFIFLLLPFEDNYGQQQTEFNWLKHEVSDIDVNDSPIYGDDQLSFLDELEKQITRRNSG